MRYLEIVKGLVRGDQPPAEKSTFLDKVDWKKVGTVALFIIGLSTIAAATIFASGHFGAGVMYTLAGSLMLFAVLPFSGSAFLFFHDYPIDDST